MLTCFLCLSAESSVIHPGCSCRAAAGHGAHLQCLIQQFLSCLREDIKKYEAFLDESTEERLQHLLTRIGDEDVPPGFDRDFVCCRTCLSVYGNADVALSLAGAGTDEIERRVREHDSGTVGKSSRGAAAPRTVGTSIVPPGGEQRAGRSPPSHAEDKKRLLQERLNVLRSQSRLFMAAALASKAHERVAERMQSLDVLPGEEAALQKHGLRGVEEAQRALKIYEKEFGDLLLRGGTSTPQMLHVKRLLAIQLSDCGRHLEATKILREVEEAYRTRSSAQEEDQNGPGAQESQRLALLENLALTSSRQEREQPALRIEAETSIVRFINEHSQKTSEISASTSISSSRPSSMTAVEDEDTLATLYAILGEILTAQKRYGDAAIVYGHQLKLLQKREGAEALSVRTVERWQRLAEERNDPAGGHQGGPGRSSSRARGGSRSISVYAGEPPWPLPERGGGVVRKWSGDRQRAGPRRAFLLCVLSWSLVTLTGLAAFLYYVEVWDHVEGGPSGEGKPDL